MTVEDRAVQPVPAKSAAQPFHRGPFVRELLGRSDYAIISELVEENSRVLDLGCGDGELLAWLAENKGVEARGIEINVSKVKQAIARGVSVYQGDIDQGLTDYPDQAFDYVILSQTLQETRRPLKVLREMLRVGRHAIVAFPNFGHWKVRLAHLVSGRAPKTRLFPYEWYDSPNIHFLTVKDFEELAERERWLIERRICLAGHHTVAFLANLFAEVAVFMICSPRPDRKERRL
jgi:methionine biosynthesis protein MetW